MASWNSVELEVLFYVLGWISFCSWAICFYPQLILNFRRKSVQGLNFDFVVLNLTKHTSYLIYNASLFFSSTVQRQYRQKYGFNQMIPVAVNDVAFSLHAVLMTALTLFQVAIYDRGNQKFSKIAIAIVSVAWLSAAACVFVALPTHSWYWLVSCFNTLQIVMTTIKYMPQAVFNFQRKSTSGFSMGYVSFDFLGSTTSFCQMMVQSIDQRSWVNLYGNIGKTLLSLVSIFFDILFMVQHFVLYTSKKKTNVSPSDDALTSSKLKMKREGRQHGMVRNYPVLSTPLEPRPRRRILNELTSPPTADLFTKVSTKPTNHSKFTGKCGRPMCRGCHSHPVSKSRDKAKGAQKIKSASDVVSNYRLITWRVVDARPGLKLTGFSATSVLDYIDYMERDYEAEDHYDDADINVEDSYRDHQVSNPSIEIIEGDDECDDNINEDATSFCEMVEDEDEDWCLVEEIM
ncbi:UNVERIFIED_CONTAM: Cystinosin [Sesamum indicum]